MGNAQATGRMRNRSNRIGDFGSRPGFGPCHEREEGRVIVSVREVRNGLLARDQIKRCVALDCC